MRSISPAILLTLLPLAAQAAEEPGAFKGTAAYCYFNDKGLTWRIGNDAVERTIHFDRNAGALKTLKVDVKNGHARLAPAPGPEGEMVVADVAGTRSPVRLDGHWAYLWQSVMTPPEGGRQLTVHLYGVGPNKGYEAEVTYEVYPGNRPYLGKSLTLINRTESSKTVVEAILDRWMLISPSVRPKKGAAPAATTAEFKSRTDGSVTLTSGDSRTGLVAGILSPGGQITFQNDVLIERVAMNLTIPGDGGRALTPKVITAAYSGPADTGNALFQRYVAAYPPIPSKFTPITNR